MMDMMTTSFNSLRSSHDKSSNFHMVLQNLKYAVHSLKRPREVFITTSFYKVVVWLASNMRIDFREICKMCDGNIDYLACHGTKIGMAIGKAFITPIEQRVNAPQIKSPLKRNDGAFLTDSACASSQRRKEMNDHLLYLAKLVLNKLATHK